MFPGWELIGQYESDVGSWLLVNGGEAWLLEVPEGLTVADVQRALKQANAKLVGISASHSHEDHLDVNVWHELGVMYPGLLVPPSGVYGDELYSVGGELLWLVKAPKHSLTDVVTVFRGVAMTGDIELGTLESVNFEVPKCVKRRSMAWLRHFPERNSYSVHTIISAHLNDVRRGVDWASLFTEKV